MSKHTPGPWKIQEWPEKGITMIVRYNAPDSWPKYGVVCEIDTPLDDCEANARLIAAAPDMLEALKMILHCNPLERKVYGKFNGYQITLTERDMDLIRNATKKAEGK